MLEHACFNLTCTASGASVSHLCSCLSMPIAADCPDTGMALASTAMRNPTQRSEDILSHVQQASGS